MAKQYRFKCVLLLAIHVLMASEPTYHLLCIYGIYHNATVCVSCEDHTVISEYFLYEPQVAQGYQISPKFSLHTAIIMLLKFKEHRLCLPLFCIYRWGGCACTKYSVKAVWFFALATSSYESTFRWDRGLRGRDIVIIPHVQFYILLTPAFLSHFLYMSP